MNEFLTSLSRQRRGAVPIVADDEGVFGASDAFLKLEILEGQFQRAVSWWRLEPIFICKEPLL